MRLGRQPGLAVGMWSYLANLNAPRIVLWCYLLWWLHTAVSYFDPSARLWLSSLGISGIIGVALYLSTAHAAHTQTKLDRWQVFRFFLMPFCVSSFAALIKDRGFVLVFHPTFEANLQALGWCAAFWALARLARSTVQRSEQQPSPKR